MRQKIENLGLGFSQKRLQKKKQVSKRRKTRGVVATFFNRSRILYVKGTRSCEAPENDGAALSSRLSLWRSRRVPALLLRVFLSLSLFLSEKFEFDSIGKTHKRFFSVPDRVRANPIIWFCGCARARGRRCAPRYKRASSARAHFGHTSRARISFFRCIVSDGVYSFSFSFFFPAFARVLQTVFIGSILTPLSLSLSRNTRTTKKQRRRKQGDSNNNTKKKKK